MLNREEGLGAMAKAIAFSHQCFPVRFPASASNVGGACCWFSTWLRVVFFQVIQIFPFRRPV